jgi:hypothetical protein
MILIIIQIIIIIINQMDFIWKDTITEHVFSIQIRTD